MSENNNSIANNNSTAIVLDYERAAMQNAPMPDGLSSPDQLMYQALCLLYTRYRLKTISREQASNEKRQLLREHEKFLHRWEMGDRYVQLIRETEGARCEYRKNRTIENADALLRAIDGIS